MKTFEGRTAVITGAASGLGLEASRIAARLGMNIVMADVQQDALDRAAGEIESLGASVLPYRLDVSKAAEVEAMGAATKQRFGAPHFVFNNAGVAWGGLIWEHTHKDWEWVIGVNLMGVAHGVRVFTPMMLDAASRDPGYEGHITNTASMAGMVNMPNMGAYNVSKHGVVSLSETLYQDLCLVTDQIRASVLCPYFVSTDIHRSHRNRPAELQDNAKPTKSQLVAQALSDKAIGSGKVSAAQVAQYVFDAVRDSRFYVWSHPHALSSVQTRLDDVVQSRNPSNPFKERPEIGERLKRDLRDAG
jgi:NAD(P)-dependent dehydrogenase (short-subunit alcohol dehydrogenase family)